MPTTDFSDVYSARTDSKRLWGRRQLLHTATGGAAAAVVIGTPFITGCGPSNDAAPAQASDGAVVPTNEAVDSSASVAQSVVSTSAAVAYRLSTRNQRAPCKACKAHAAHRYFASAEAAAAGRAHAGCACAVVTNPVTAQQLETWFVTTASDTFDDRWGG